MFAEILKQWNIPPVEAVRPVGKTGGKTWFVSTASGDSFVLKSSGRLNAENEFKFRSALSRTRLPVAPPILTPDGSWYIEDGQGDVLCLYPKLPGEVYADHYTGGFTQKARRLGRAIGLLHSCLLETDGVKSPRQLHLVGHLREWAVPTIGKSEGDFDVRPIMAIWEDAQGRLVSLEHKMPAQLIHRDAHPSNMLFDAGVLTGFLDFELAARGLRLFDVCYCGSAILVDGFEDPERAENWPRLFQSLLQGYQEHNPLTASERECVYEMLAAINLIFMAYWLDSGELETAHQDERLLFWLEQHKAVLKDF
jgi:Ser/Thr protein kinase RdoA (MazF antagonist)